jgi:hypothetical protein
MLNLLMSKGFTRVERDDRLLDIFPQEISEKGIEMWERWDKEDIYLLRLHLPFRAKFTKLYKLPRAKIEKALKENQVKKLSSYKPISIQEGFLS